MKNYKLVMQGITTHFLPLKALQFHKRYLYWGLFKTQESKIQELIFRVDNIFKYIKHLPFFSTNQRLPDEKIIDLDQEVRKGIEVEIKTGGAIKIQGLEAIKEIIEIMIGFREIIEIIIITIEMINLIII